MSLKISHTVVPDSWMPKPKHKAHNFMDWATKRHYWLLWIKRDISELPAWF